MPEFRLEITGPDSSWERVLGHERETIGRAADNSIVLDDGGVSRSHARIDSRDGDLFLVDEGSANGTSVNGARLDSVSPYSLQDGDRIGIGPYTLVFRVDDFAGTVLNALPAPHRASRVDLPNSETNPVCHFTLLISLG